MKSVSRLVSQTRAKLPAVMLFVCMGITVRAQTFTNLFNFNFTNGEGPYYMSPVQGTDANFYGTTETGGSGGLGTVFKITSAGTLTTLHSFTGSSGDGSNPYGGLALGTDGNFYGTTEAGGTGGDGVVFKITPSGTITTLHSFTGSGGDGSNPYGALALGTDGNFYGTTEAGGTGGIGTVFKITPSGTITTVHSFTGSGGDGSHPYGGLALGTDGNFYGTTEAGGTGGDGVVFKITPSGTITTLHSFTGSGGDGSNPYGALALGTDGNFYGTTEAGGTGGIGTAFKITPSGTIITLHSFTGSGGDGSNPYDMLAVGTDGNFYGSTFQGGSNGDGMIFEITSGGTLTKLHSFNFTDGADVHPGLLQATSGTLYGATTGGGVNSDGSIYSLSNSLAACVRATPSIGAVGATVIILGNGLTGATKVSFNGTSATFTVVSSTEITTKVPTGATSGSVKVTTSSGTILTSVLPFTVQ